MSGGPTCDGTYDAGAVAGGGREKTGRSVARGGGAVGANVALFTPAGSDRTAGVGAVGVNAAGATPGKPASMRATGGVPKCTGAACAGAGGSRAGTRGSSGAA